MEDMSWNQDAWGHVRGLVLAVVGHRDGLGLSMGEIKACQRLIYAQTAHLC
jgi:hypothetical protein